MSDIKLFTKRVPAAKIGYSDRHIRFMGMAIDGQFFDSVHSAEITLSRQAHDLIVRFYVSQPAIVALDKEGPTGLWGSLVGYPVDCNTIVPLCSSDDCLPVGDPDITFGMHHIQPFPAGPLCHVMWMRYGDLDTSDFTYFKLTNLMWRESGQQDMLRVEWDDSGDVPKPLHAVCRDGKGTIINSRYLVEMGLIGVPQIHAVTDGNEMMEIVNGALVG